MKFFFNKCLCVYSRLVLCFFFAVSGNPLVACEGFETRSNTDTIIDFGELNFVMSPNGSFDQEEDIDTDDDCKKKLLLAGYARKNFNNKRLPSFLEEKLDLAIMPYIGKIDKESTMPISTNDNRWISNDSFLKNFSALKEAHSRLPVKRVYRKKRNITVIIKHTDSLVDPKEVILYHAPKELLLYGFLSTENRVYIPDDILQVLILFLHDNKMPNKIKESERVENVLKRQIERVKSDLAHAKERRKELDNSHREYLKNFGCISYFFSFSLAGTVTSGIMLSEGEKTGFWGVLLSIFSLGTICSIVWLRCLLKE